MSFGAQFRDGGGSVSGREVVSFGAWGQSVSGCEGREGVRDVAM